ncbi:Multidrug resistance-associated protein [Blattamonas nauphoetae]|uniref:Multidrug resistance-associated protein n=1 Tax=Blattamonas nauphoetae TaxID=2049346 RepID=A0ABQ9XHF1_9EUKA|nr:Multidrug resistance-associated protein [Blattamonas nauphoetae]
MNITIAKGSLTMIVGEVGCGKSSLGEAIRGLTTTPFEGSSHSTSITTKNYWNTVRACPLESEIKIFAAEDETTIGEKGVNLCGGQKARIQPARAIYSDKDIYILDDPPSAVEAYGSLPRLRSGLQRHQPSVDVVEGEGWLDHSILVSHVLVEYWVKAMSRSACIRYNKLLDIVMDCPSSLFDTTPMGRLFNRFTGDIPQIDLFLFSQFLQVIGMWVGPIGQVVIVCVDMPWFLAIGLHILVLFMGLSLLSARVSQNLQRLESITRSPVLSHFSESVTGDG